MSFEQRAERRMVTAQSDDIRAILKFKITEYDEKKLPIEQCLADYIGNSVADIDDKIKRLKAYKQEITDGINALTLHKAESMQECYLALTEDMGVDKLKGIAVSSITLKDENVSVTKKFVLDADKDELVKLGFGYYEDVIKSIPATIKINQKREK